MPYFSVTQSVRSSSGIRSGVCVHISVCVCGERCQNSFRGKRQSGRDREPR